MALIPITPSVARMVTRARDVGLYEEYEPEMITALNLAKVIDEDPSLAPKLLKELSAILRTLRVRLVVAGDHSDW